MTALAETPLARGFDGSRDRFEALLGFLDGEGATALSHSSWRLASSSTGASCCAGSLEDHLDLRADRERRVEAVVDADGVAPWGRRARARAGAGHGVRRRAGIRGSDHKSAWNNAKR
jgi:hypothetical protein